MHLDESDKAVIRSIFRDETKEMMDKLEKNTRDIQAHDQSLYGPDGSNGLRSRMHKAEENIIDLKTFRTQVKTVLVTIVPAVQAFLTILLMYIKSLLFGKG